LEINGNAIEVVFNNC